MNCSSKIKNKRKEQLKKDRSNDSFTNLYNSFQSSEINNRLKLKYSILDNIKLSNFRINIIFKINQNQHNQQKTNIKLSSLISIVISKLIGSKNYKIFHTHFSIINNKKIQNIINIKKENYNERIKTESNKDNNNTERLNISNININKKKIENISLASELEIKRYNLSNQKTKTKENIFKLNNEKKNNSNNKNINKYEKENEEFYNNSNSNLFRINNNNNYYNNNLNKNPSSDNLNNSKKHFNISNSRKPVTFNEIALNINYQNNNKNNFHSNVSKNKNIYNNENNDLKKIYINASNYDNFQKNNSINKERDFNKSNISLDNNSNKRPVKIKFNSNEKPILLMNFNESLEKSSERNKLNKNKNNFNNIINISNNLIERTDDKKYNSINGSQGLSLKIEDSTNNFNYKNENGDASPDSNRGKRKFSESKSEAESNYSNLSGAKQGQGFSRKIRGFNFRNNIKFNKKPNSNKISEDDYNKIKGGSVRYSNNNGLLAQINSFEN